MKTVKESDKERTWPQILAIIIVSLTPLTTGIFFAWPSASIPKIINEDQLYNITEEEASYFTVVSPITTIIISPIFSMLTDKIGRRPTILMIGILQALSWISILFANSVWVFYLSRFFYGASEASFYSSVPLYIGEISTPKVRQTWGNFMIFVIYFGVFTSNLVGSYFSVRETAVILLSVPVIFLFIFPFMPESPYFYIIKNNPEEAKESMKWLKRKTDIEEDFIVLKTDVERQLSESGTWKDLWTIDSNRRALYAGIFLRLSQQLAGIGAISSYTQLIFDKSGGDLSASASSMIFTGALCVCVVTGSFILDKFGRRKTYFISLLACGILLFIESVYMYIDQFMPEFDISKVKWIPLAGMLAYCFFFAMGLAILPVIMLGEIFSTSIKTKGLCILNIEYGICISVITKLFHLLESNIGLFCPFLFFSISCLISCVVSLFLVPETKGKTLEEIQQSLKEPIRKMK